MVNAFDWRTIFLAKHAQHVVLIHFPIALGDWEVGTSDGFNEIRTRSKGTDTDAERSLSRGMATDLLLHWDQ
jgi:hypothetical protein